MRVLVAGATGVLGRPLVPLLVSAGYEVVGLARTRPAGPPADLVRMVAVDALDRLALEAAVREAAPDAVVTMLTAIPAEIDPKRMARQFRLTNRLRTEGTRNLLEAAAAVGVRRFITEGLAYAYDPRGDGPADEDQPLWQDPPRQFASSVRALAESEQLTRDAGGLVLRFGHLYGPGTVYAQDGSVVRQVRAGRMPVVGRRAATFSFTHTHDAAAAVLAALRTDISGALNVVDDEPAPVTEWLPALATLLGAPVPGHVPALLARVAVGEWGVAFMTRLRGADNTRARQSLDWQPRYPSWRDGFRAELTAPAPIPSVQKGKS